MAETIAATTSTTAKTTVYYVSYSSNQVGGFFSSLSAAGSYALSINAYNPADVTRLGGVVLCANGSSSLTTGNSLCTAAKRTSDNATLPPISISSNTSTGSPSFYLNSTTGCAAPAVESGGQCQSTTCPAGQNWTLSGSTCTRPDCVAPQTRDPATGVCQIICPTAGSNAMVSGAKAWGISGTSGSCTSGIAFSGCKITCTSGVSAGGKASCTGCTFTGTLATTGDVTADPTTQAEKDAPTKPEECLAQGKGYVTTSTGTTCVSSSSSPDPVTTKTTETTTTKNGAGATTGTQETTVECTGDTCTTTKVTKDAAGVVTGSSTSTGSGEASGADGKKDKETDCDKHPESIGCMVPGAPTDSEVDENPIGPSNISPVSLGGEMSCPADQQLPRGQVFTWTPICTYAVSLRPIIIVMAWLAAGFIVLGFGGKDNG